MTKKTTLIPIYSKDYYRFKKLLLTPRFQERVRWSYSLYQKFGIPVPSQGFKTYQRYEEWLSLFWKKLIELEKIHGPQKVRTTYKEWEEGGEKKFKIKSKVDLSDSRFPPVPGQFVEELLEEFGFDEKNREYKDFLSSYLFRGKKEYQEQLLATRGIRNPKTGKFEWFIQIFPHTKKEHICENWDFIQDTLEGMPGYIGKNKPWESFERDLYVHKIYKDLQDKLESKRASYSKGEKSIAEQTWLLAKKRYPGLNLSRIRDIVARVETLNKE